LGNAGTSSHDSSCSTGRWPLAFSTISGASTAITRAVAGTPASSSSSVSTQVNSTSAPSASSPARQDGRGLPIASMTGIRWIPQATIMGRDWDLGG